ncbi:hypothetical protein [Pseudonocardia sp. GCM10023141]|uniref:hypothetical protein n=1 Tax=Pseudonocardia sp. GCM10023141 TaxID=3252653 RepID=UPI00360996E9
MDIANYLIPAAAIIWIVYRQFVGRYANPARMILPLVLIVLGVSQTVSAHIDWTPAVIGIIGADLFVTVVLGAIRGGAIKLSMQDGYLFQRGGVTSLVLWLVSIGARVLFGVFAAGTGAGPASTATLMLSFGISIAAQYVVLSARIRADGRPIRPSGDRRPTRSGSTLGR